MKREGECNSEANARRVNVHVHVHVHVYSVLLNLPMYTCICTVL